MMLSFRIRMQFDEAFGEVNKYYCSEHFRRDVNDRELLMTYFIKSGGADDFDYRFQQAMAMKNRRNCAGFYGREISDQETLWNYYMLQFQTGSVDCGPRVKSRVRSDSIHEMALT